MTQVAENPELEAAIAEAELTDEEATMVRSLVGEGGQAPAAIAFVVGERDELEPQADEVEQLEPATGEPSKKQLRDLERALTLHEETVHAIMGPFVAGFGPCATCGGVGLTAPGPKPQTHSNYKACPTCQGFGEVLTGSTRGGYESIACPECKGRGFLERLDAQGAPVVAQVGTIPDLTASPPPPPPPTTAAPANGDAGGETWGTPAWMGDTSLTG